MTVTEKEIKYGIKRKGSGGESKPEEFERLQDKDFADPVNYAYPIDPDHVAISLKYFSKEENRSDYDTDEQAKIWGRIIAALPEDKQQGAKEIAGFDRSDIVEEFQNAMFDDLLSQLDEVHSQILNKIKYKTGTKATRFQIAAVKKLLESIGTKLQEDEQLETEVEDSEINEEAESLVQSFSTDGNENVVCFTSEKFGFVDGGDVETFDSAGKVQYLDKKAKVFEVGVHRGVDYSREYIDELNSNFVPPREELKGWTVPMQGDHSKSCYNTIGHPRKFWREGDEVFAMLRYVDEEAIRKVNNGLFGPLSSGIDNQARRWDHVAHTPFPQIMDAEVFDKSKKGENNMGKKEGVETMADDKTVSTVEFARQQDEWKAEFAKQQNQIEEMARQKAELEDKIQLVEDEKFIDQFTKGNEIRTTPAMRAEEISFYHGLNATQKEQFAKIKGLQPPVVDLKTYGSADAMPPGKKRPSKEEVTAEARKLIESTQ